MMWCGLVAGATICNSNTLEGLLDVFATSGPGGLAARATISWATHNFLQVFSHSRGIRIPPRVSHFCQDYEKNCT